MRQTPKIGDVWFAEGDDGKTVYATVTAVEPPNGDPGSEWRIKLGEERDGCPHLGWWYGQGWEKLEPEIYNNSDEDFEGRWHERWHACFGFDSETFRTREDAEDWIEEQWYHVRSLLE